MDFDDDVHLCIKCGRTIEGLDNYVSHRKQFCNRYNQPYRSPFLSANFSLNEPPVEDLQSVSPQDILSADDFFSCLNLQSNSKSNIDSKPLSTCNDTFCSRLDSSIIDTSISSGFFSNGIVEDIPIVGIEKVLPEDKTFDSEKEFCQNSSLKSTPDELSETSISPDNSVSSLSSERKLNKPIKKINKYLFTDFTKLQVPRTSYRQKINANDSLNCCIRNDKYFVCSFCDIKFAFPATFLDHIVVCKKASDEVQRKAELFNHESLLVRSSHFRCLLCSFYCADSFLFLNHLKSPNHCQNAAILKLPLICLPCQDECSASDEMKEHFSKNHLQYEKEDHPIIIAKKMRNLHCCHCLTLTKSSSLLSTVLDKPGQSVVVEDCDYIKGNLPLISGCGYGIEKNSLSSCIANFTQVAFDDKSNKVSKTSDEDCAETIKETKPKHNGEQLDSPSESVPEYIVTKIEADDKHIPKLSLKKLQAKITIQNAKLILKRSKKGNFKKKWICNDCGSHHHSQLSLNRHLDNCSSEKLHLENDDLLNRTSKSIRNGEKQQFLCDQCVYVGKSVNQLTRHSRTHTGVKPFRCTQCNFRCSLSSQIIRHKRVHTGQKPYKCPHCAYECNTHENLRKHILKTKKHKGKKMYPCKHCDYESNDFVKFKDHLTEIHSKIFLSNTNTGLDFDVLN